MVLGFSVRGNATVLAHGVRSRVVGSQRQVRFAERLQHHREVAGGPVEVLQRITRVDAQITRSCWHQLAQTNGARG